jgi:type II secretory pathway pseudopilin PulG
MSGKKPSQQKGSRFPNSLGMTLVELLVAVGVTSIVATLSIAIFVSQLSHYERGKSVKLTQESGQTAIELMKSELMQAGWSVMPEMAFFFEDGGAGGTDRVYMNDTRLIDLNMPAERRHMILEDCPGGQLITAGNNSTSPRVQKLDIDDDESDGDATGADFVAGITQYVISNDGALKIARITGVSGGNQLSLDRVIGGTYLAPAVFYCADDGNPLCNPAGSEQGVLRRSDRDSSGRQPIAENVVDLQIAYQDVNNNWYGQAGCAGVGAGPNFCGFSPFDPKQIQLIRVSVVSKGTALQADRLNDPLYCRPALENHSAAALGSNECGYVYRTYTTVLQPRNAGPNYR